jgi:hypothetical protein
MATAVSRFESAPAPPVQVLAIPWRESHTVEPEQLQQYISMLERACVEHPRNADFRTCLGMAHAMNFALDRSVDALEEARRIEPENFFAQLKLGESHYRLRALDRADNETCRAAELAANATELSLARKQLAEIRCLRWESSQIGTGRASRNTWTLIALVLMALAACILLAWK